MQISKSAFPVAAIGKRFLPATKASPTERLTIIDKSLVPYVVKTIAAGHTEMIFVTSRNKGAIEDHFDKAYERKAELEVQDKQAMLGSIRSIKPVAKPAVQPPLWPAIGERNDSHFSSSLRGVNPHGKE